MRRSMRGAWALLACSLTAVPAAGWAEDGRLSAQAQAAVGQLDAKDPYVRQLGFLRLEALREPAVSAVVRQYLDAADWRTRAYSVRAVAAIDGPAVAQELAGRLATERHPHVRVSIILALEPFKDPAVIPAIVGRLRESKPEVRMAAIDALSRIDHSQAREALLLHAKRESHRDVRRVLDDALRRLFAS